MNKPKCSQCKRELKHYEDDFSMSFDQYEGTICENCNTVRCDTCWPTARGTTCPTCGGNLQPAFGRYLVRA
jgi:hypothetical protein